MKRILMASAVALTAAGGQALAADLPPPMAPPPRAPAAYIPMAPVYNWTGFYIGGNLGAGSRRPLFRTPPAAFSTRATPTHRSLAVAKSASITSSMGGVVDRRRGYVRLASQHQQHHDRNGHVSWPAVTTGSGTIQQSLADDRNRQARLRLGPRDALRKGRLGVGRPEQFERVGYCAGRRGHSGVFVEQQHTRWLDCRRRC